MIDKEDEDLKLRQTQNDPVSATSTYDVKVNSKTKQKKGTLSDVYMIGLQRGTVTVHGALTTQSMSRIKLKHSEAQMKDFRLNTIINPSAISDFVVGEGSQIVTGVARAAQSIAATLGAGRKTDQKPPMFDFNSRKLDGRIYSLNKCKNLDLNGDMKSSDPNSWWRGMENIRLALRIEL